MKKIINLILVAALFYSCSQPAADTTAFDQGLASFEKNKAIADKVFNLFIEKDLDGMVDMYADDLIYSPANTNDTLTKADLREAMTGWMENFEVFTFDQRQYYPGVDENFIPDGSVRSYGVWHGTHISGAKTKSKYYSVTRFNDEGKVTTALEWFDVGGVFDQIESQN